MFYYIYEYIKIIVQLLSIISHKIMKLIIQSGLINFTIITINPKTNGIIMI